MRKITILGLIFLLCVSVAYATTLTLNSPSPAAYSTVTSTAVTYNITAVGTSGGYNCSFYHRSSSTANYSLNKTVTNIANNTPSNFSITYADLSRIWYFFSCKDNGTGSNMVNSSARAFDVKGSTSNYSDLYFTTNINTGTYNTTSAYFIGDGSKLTGLPGSTFNLTAIVANIGNWSADKPSYTATSGLVAILGNWSADKSSYTATSGLVAILGNWSADKSSYYTSAQTISAINDSNNSMRSYVDGADSLKYDKAGGTITGNVLINGNLTVIGSEVELNVTNQKVNGSILPNVDNVFNLGSSSMRWANIFASNIYNTTQVDSIVSSIGNFTAWDKDLQDMTGQLNWSSLTEYPVACPANSAVTTIGDTTTCTDGLYTLANIVANIGNWSADKSSYYTSAQVDTLGNWSADKASYALQSNVDSRGNWTADKNTNSFTGNLTLPVDTSNHKIYDNTTCVIITGDTATLEIC